MRLALTLLSLALIASLRPGTRSAPVAAQLGPTVVPDPTDPALAGLDVPAFLDVARASPCTDRMNRMWGIDGEMVYWHAEGSCADFAYHAVLFGRTAEIILCSSGDSIAGPRFSCTDPAGQALFDTVSSHVREPDLGLGPNHQVTLFNDGQPACPPVSGAAVDSPALRVLTFAGSDTPGYTDGLGAAFRGPRGLAVDAQGLVYVADTGNHVIRRISPDGTVSTVAGSGQAGFADGVGTAARFRLPTALAVGGDGTLVVADTGNLAVRRIAPDGTVSTLADAATLGYDPSANRGSTIGPTAVGVDGSGSVVVLDRGHMRVVRILPDGTVSSLVTAAAFAERTADGTVVQFDVQDTLAVDSGETVVLYLLRGVGRSYLARVASDGTVARLPIPSTYRPGCLDRTRPGPPLLPPAPAHGMAVDPSGTIYFTDSEGYQVRALRADGTVIGIAGSGAMGNTDGTPQDATFTSPIGLAVTAGTLYVTDGNRVRAVPLSR